MGEVVKNPNRNKPRQVEPRKPEYERLGITPTQFKLNNYRSGNLLPPTFQEETISEMDGISFNEEGMPEEHAIKKDSHIIDNNEFLNFSFPTASKVSQMKLEDSNSNNEIEQTSLPSNVPSVGEYILMIAGNIVLSGSLKIIEEKVKNILYGEDIDFDPSEVSQKDIIVLKRVDVQVGIFIRD